MSTVEAEQKWKYGEPPQVQRVFGLEVTEQRGAQVDVGGNDGMRGARAHAMGV
jgi:hypothetical protein